VFDIVNLLGDDLLDDVPSIATPRPGLGFHAYFSLIILYFGHFHCVFIYFTGQHYNFRADAIADFARLLTQRRFQHVNFALVKHHVSYIDDLTRKQLFEAIEKHKESTPTEEYTPPFLQHILPYLKEDETVSLKFGDGETEVDHMEAMMQNSGDRERKVMMLQRTKNRRLRRVSANVRFMMGDEPLSALELRILFVSILKGAYDTQIANGELDDSHILSVTLIQSLDFVADGVVNGEALRDWEYLMKLHKPLDHMIHCVKGKVVTGCLNRAWYKRSPLGLKASRPTQLIERSLAVMAAHRSSQEYFKAEFQDVDSELSEAGKVVLHESEIQYNMAEAALNEFDREIVELAVSHKFCKILLTMGISHVGKLTRVGLLKETEAEHFVEEIEGYFDELISCKEAHHPGEKEFLSEPHDAVEPQEEAH
jgi:hypothetical protein